MNLPESRRRMKIIGITLLIYAMLVASHEGEFWPFSIYPMFSQAGNPWTRAMVMDVTDLPDEEIWLNQPLESKAGTPVALREIGVDQIDYSNFISKTENWTDSRRDAVRTMFGPENIGEARWMAAKVHGRMIGEDSVAVQIQPFLLVTADSVYMNPLLDESDYFLEENP
ncbi:MAG: hypothetical protein JJU13_08785 [Balneolaceae bacterium]|nr:hypothetical protein [Balneolaceae bacterium]